MVKWIKIQTDIFDNRKIKQIDYMPESDAIIVIWFKLLCLCGKVNDNGMIYLTTEVPYTEEMLAKEFGKDISVIRLALKTFEMFGMLEVIDNIYCISNWEKYQNIEGMEKIREQNRIRKQNQRIRQRETNAIELESHVTSRDSHATDIDKELEIDKEKKKIKKFIKPTLEEVSAYIQENLYRVDAQHFIDYYESNGWKVGKNSMKDWKASIRTWHRNGYKLTQPKQENNRAF